MFWCSREMKIIVFIGGNVCLIEGGGGSDISNLDSDSQGTANDSLILLFVFVYGFITLLFIKKVSGYVKTWVLSSLW